jgi:predicted metal-dependent enzyme (double-stranded beta helix superfamily)
VQPFDPDAFVQSCINALGEWSPADAIRELVQRAVSEPRSLELACPVPVDLSDDGVVYVSDEVLVCHAIFPRRFQTGIHNHTVEAVIGVWSGYEDNLLFEETDGGLRALGARRVGTGDVLVLGADAIHDVHTPPTTWSAALHVYLGNISTVPRKAWQSADSPPSVLDGEQQDRHWTEVAVATGLAVNPTGSATHP